MIIEIINIWVKIMAIIVIWEVWKYLGWRLVCWVVDKQMEQYERSKRK